MSEIKELQKEILKFNTARDWMKHHSPKNLSSSIVIEAAELLEHFQWRTDPKETKIYIKKHKEEIADEIADVAIYLLNLCTVLNLDLSKAIKNKINKNSLKYPRP